ncbi:GntR family transcriptional regulator [Arthrobacter luteolus]|uniref:GntR family transcriptional regulator n=1 Tax=Arthrobacter luteolus TaxID=98672 RepID=UPI00384C0889
MARTEKSSSLGNQTHSVIRREILAGRWSPGERLQPTLLSKLTSTSTTIVREALTRLAGENLVTIQTNRGYFVPSLSLDALQDLTELRCVSEELGLRLAIERGDLEWESSLIATHHRLAQTPRRADDDHAHVTEEWHVAHRNFHLKLLDACQVPAILDLSNSLSNATELYRRWSAPSLAASARNVEDEHAAILQATLARDTTKATKLLRQHYEATVNVVLAAGLVGGERILGDGKS